MNDLFALAPLIRFTLHEDQTDRSRVNPMGPASQETPSEHPGTANTA